MMSVHIIWPKRRLTGKKKNPHLSIKKKSAKSNSDFKRWFREWKPLLQLQLDRGHWKASETPRRWKLFRWVGSSSRQGEARFHCRFLQTDTPEAASKNPPTACWNDFSALAICDKENNIRKSIFSGCLKTGAPVTSALEDVTRPMSEWNINSFKIDLLYQPNTVLYQRRRSALHLSAQKETHTHPSACNIICREMLW